VESASSAKGYIDSCRRPALSHCRSIDCPRPPQTLYSLFDRLGGYRRSLTRRLEPRLAIFTNLNLVDQYLSPCSCGFAASSHVHAIDFENFSPDQTTRDSVANFYFYP